MTALTTSARPGQHESPRPVRWRQLAWVSWRQCRFALADAAVILGVLALYVLIMGLRIRGAYASVTSCHSSNSQACQDVNDLFSNTYYITAEVTDALLYVVPVLVGVFAGVPAHRGRLAARAIAAPPRRDRLAGPPPRYLTQGVRPEPGSATRASGIWRGPGGMLSPAGSRPDRQDTAGG